MRRTGFYIFLLLFLSLTGLWLPATALVQTNRSTHLTDSDDIATPTDSLSASVDTMHHTFAKQGTDTILDSLALNKAERDTTRRDTTRFVRKPVDLDNTIKFSAKDSIVMYGKDNAYMFGSSNINYGDMSLKAEEIMMDLHKTTVYAIGKKDSVGELKGNPVFKDKSGEYESKTMRYNFKTKKGYITDIVTEQGEGFLSGGVTKKMDNDEYYIKNGRYTTCSDHEHPHFYFNITKGKVKPQKNIVTGPVYLVVSDVPLPLALPFGFFPFSKKYSSGIIVPTFGDDYSKGFYLRDGGYYFAFNDNMDLALTGEIYTRGSWGITAKSQYKKRYKFSGNFNLSYITTITGDKGASDYSKAQNFRVSWTHTQDSKSNPNLSLSASVDFTTSGYTRNDLNSYYNSSFTENTKSSSVNMTYKIPNSKWSFSASANINQRTADSTLTVSFPNLTITMSQHNPFKRKHAVGSTRWYEKIQLSYQGQFQNSLTAKQNVFFKKNLLRDWRNGMKHSATINATFNLFKYINITPSIKINDRMYSSRVRRAWDPNKSAEVVVDTTYSFYNSFDFNASIGLSTKIYGFWKPMKFLGEKVQMIRHVLTPSITFSGSPDFSAPGWGSYGSYDYTLNGQTYHKRYSYFQNNIFGGPSQGSTGMLTWSLDNNIEMKVKSDKDSTGVKKISLIEKLSLSQSYNFAADSLKWSNLTANATFRIVKNFNLNLNTTWDVYTYKLNSSGTPVRVNTTRLKAGKGLAKLSSFSTSFSYTLNNDTFRKKKSTSSSSGAATATGSTSTEATDEEKKKKQSQNETMQTDSDGYAHWSFPWSLTLNYSVNYGYGDFDYERMDYKGKWTQNLSLSGSVKPTKNWNFTFSASYNFATGKLSYMNCTVTRNLHCFEMSASFVPVGPYKSYNFKIAVNASMLKDFKYDKRSSSTTGVDWY